MKQNIKNCFLNILKRIVSQLPIFLMNEADSLFFLTQPSVSLRGETMGYIQGVVEAIKCLIQSL